MLHSEAADPNALRYMNARDDASLKKLSEELLPVIRAKRDTLDRLIRENETATIRLSPKTQKFWELKRLASDGILSVLQDGARSTEELDPEASVRRVEFFKAANEAWERLEQVLLQVHQEVIGPYLLGMLELLGYDGTFPGRY